MITRATLIGCLLLAGCHRSGDTEVEGAHPESPAPVSPPAKGSQMNSYVEQTAVTQLTVAEAGAIDDTRAEMLAYAPDGSRWAGAWGHGVRIFAGDAEQATRDLNHVAAGSIGFTADGSAIQLGLLDFDIAGGKWRAQPPVGDLAVWASGKGLPAPPKLSIEAARKSPDGALIALSATGVTQDRIDGMQEPATGSVDWLIVLDGTSRAPTQALWHGTGRHNRFAISADHVAAAGQAGLRIFERADLAKMSDLGDQLRPVIALAWSPDGSLLAALGQEKDVRIWRAGSWDKPAASWQVGADYGSALAFHPTRPLLLVGNRDGHVRIYSVASAALGAPVELADLDVGGNVRGIAVAPDGTSARVSAGYPRNQIVKLALTPAP